MRLADLFTSNMRPYKKNMATIKEFNKIPEEFFPYLDLLNDLSFFMKCLLKVPQVVFQVSCFGTPCTIKSCLTEKTQILTSQHEHLLNKWNELMGICRHRRKFLLSGIT